MSTRIVPAPLTSVVAQVQELRDAVGHRAQRALAVARARWLFRSLQSVGRNVAAYGAMRVENEGTVELGDRLTFVGGMMPGSLVCHAGARLVIGSDVQFNYGISLESWESVQIGARCMFASFVRIADRDGHTKAPIVIEDDVWVAHGAIIMPGVRVGARSVVAAGSVVTHDVPPDTLAMGNPARNMSMELVSRETGT
ncbi:DapH/DapD/GlmU-related protein [Myxococcus sp. RHSTA-1-4]|uniref:acyltransferase n=1 Tax=Myxococcus sp. RHSTA-1-4 TaxID=2874601 RepID=UPI001CC0C553|nr:acyltransferase [Myxococcus sp. RHSTA-1-4]MBZ4415681.1 acyltransferase [Myxococcus sp. RHSTA-1-4]